MASSFAQTPDAGYGTAVRWPVARRTSLAPGAEQEILDLVNRERQSRGLAPLAADARLQEAARRHSERMAAANQLGHQLDGEPDLSRRLGERSLRFDTSGENVAFAADAPRAHSALMHSPHHRANILDREYNSIGIGVVRTGEGIFVTQDFARLLPEASVADAEEQVARDLDHARGASLRRVPAPELRRRACEMAASDRLNPGAGDLPGASNAVAFTAEDLTHISGSLRSLHPRSARAFSVGACYRSSASYDNPVFWIIVATYR